MARINNLPNFLEDVANAIKTKKGSDTAIPVIQKYLHYQIKVYIKVSK